MLRLCERSNNAGISLRQVRSPEPPKITNMLGSRCSLVFITLRFHSQERRYLNAATGCALPGGKPRPPVARDGGRCITVHPSRSRRLPGLHTLSDSSYLCDAISMLPRDEAPSSRSGRLAPLLSPIPVAAVTRSQCCPSICPPDERGLRRGVSSFLAEWNASRSSLLSNSSYLCDAISMLP